MKKFATLICLLIVLVSVLPVYAQEAECTEKGGNWDAKAETCLLKGGLDIQISYPTELMQHDFVEQTVDDFISTKRAEFLQWYSESSFYPGSSNLWSLYIIYETYQQADTILSLSFTVSDYTGGAHPNSYFQTFIFDVTQEKVLAFEDIFVESALTTISPIVQASLTETLGDLSDAAWIETGTGTDPINYQNFVLTEESVIFLFNPYQVAPYVAGPQMVEIPLTDLSAVLTPEFVP